MNQPSIIHEIKIPSVGRPAPAPHTQSLQGQAACSVSSPLRVVAVMQSPFLSRQTCCIGRRPALQCHTNTLARASAPALAIYAFDG